MSRRERTTTIVCAEKPCREVTFYTYSPLREYDEIEAAQAKRPWRCTRHASPDEVLRPDSLSTTVVLVASKVRSLGFEREKAGDDAVVARIGPHGTALARKPGEFLPGLFWLPEGGAHGSGFTHGPGFKAHANDFPEGTRLTVTTRIDMPEGD